jgi:membrane-associated protein
MSISLSDLPDLILSWMVIYGPLMIMAVLFLGALGVPAPATFTVVATGAFVRQGVLDLQWVLLAALAGVLLGDALSFGMGRFAGGFMQRRFAASPLWQQAEDELERRGGIAIYLTRWLLTPPAVALNLVAGGAGYPFARFMLFDIAGEVTWLLLYGALGFAFSSQWEAVSDFISNFSGLLVGVVILVGGVYLLRRNWQSSSEAVRGLIWKPRTSWDQNRK